MEHIALLTKISVDKTPFAAPLSSGVTASCVKPDSTNKVGLFYALVQPACNLRLVVLCNGYCSQSNLIKITATQFQRGQWVGLHVPSIFCLSTLFS